MFKFNGGRGAIICDTCDVIIKQPATGTETKPLGDYCAEHGSVVPLATARRARIIADGPAAHQRGEAFRLLQYEFDEQQIGHSSDGRVVFIFLPEELDGLQMSRLDARALGEALIFAADAEINRSATVRAEDLSTKGSDNGE